MKVDPYLMPYTKFNSDGSNIKAKTTVLSEENTGVNLHDLGLGNGLLAMTLRVQAERKNRC
jgi:hypothetical protein